MEGLKNSSVTRMLDDRVCDAYTTLLDIGCGYGEDVQSVWERRGIRMFGIDRDEVKIAEALRRSPRAMLRAADAEEMNFPDRYFDGILIKQTLSAINMQRDALYLARCALKETGRIYLADYYIRIEDPEAIALAQKTAEEADLDAALHGNCVTRQRKRPSKYCVGKAFVGEKLRGLLESAGLKSLHWEDASSWEEAGVLEPQEGYFFLIAERNH